MVFLSTPPKPSDVENVIQRLLQLLQKPPYSIHAAHLCWATAAKHAPERLAAVKHALQPFVKAANAATKQDSSDDAQRSLVDPSLEVYDAFTKGHERGEDLRGRLQEAWQAMRPFTGVKGAETALDCLVSKPYDLDLVIAPHPDSDPERGCAGNCSTTNASFIRQGRQAEGAGRGRCSAREREGNQATG